MPTTRRTALKLLAGLSLPTWFPRLTFSTPHRLSASGERDVLVCVFLRGGMDGLNAVAPIADNWYHDSRPSIALDGPGSQSPDAALELDDRFGLHPALAPLLALYQDGALAIVHAAGSPDETRSHFDAMDFMERGTPGSKTISTGWLGRHLETASWFNDSPFRAVSISPRVPTSLRGSVPATALQSIADFHLRGREDQVAAFQTAMGALYDGGALLDVQARQTFAAIESLASADPGRFTPNNGATYPETEFGAGLSQVAQMIRADLGLEIACLDLGGWDTHEGEGAGVGRMAGLLAELAAGLEAFWTDLDERTGRISIVVLSEFGRRLRENAAGGTDHGRANCILLLGGGVVGGQVYADWPGLAPEQLEPPGDLRVTTDFRAVLAELLTRRLANPAIATIFPGFEPGRPLGLFRSMGRQLVERS